MKKMNLELVHRAHGTPIKLHPTDPLLSIEPQRRLAELHQIYDLRCLCTEEGVLMHIRHMSKTGLYYVADHPTSGMHATSCSLSTNRIGMTDTESEIPAPIDSFEFKLRDSSDSNQPQYIQKEVGYTKTKYPHTRKLYLLLLTLIQNGFGHITFSNRRNFQAFAKKIIEAKGRTISLSGSDVTVNQLVSYGAGGLPIALEKAKKTNGIAFWLAYTPSLDTSVRAVTLYEVEHRGVTVIRPYAAIGPHIALAVVSSKGIVEVALQPIISSKLVYPVFSDKNRVDASLLIDDLPSEAADGLLSWITIDLWGEDEGPGALYRTTKLRGIKNTQKM